MPVVPAICSYIGPITNCMATNIATTMSAMAKLSTSRFIAVLIDLFKRKTRITNVFPTRSNRTIKEKAMLRPMYCIDKVTIVGLKRIVSEKRVTTWFRTLHWIQHKSYAFLTGTGHKINHPVSKTGCRYCKLGLVFWLALNRAVYTRENKPRLTLAAAYMRKELFIYEY